MLTPALMAVVGSAALRAETVTVETDGKEDGAVKTAEVGLVTTIVPKTELPPAIPFTSHTNCVAAGVHRIAVKVCDFPNPRLAVVGEIEFWLHCSVTVALAKAEGSATLRAVTVTEGTAGIVAGAV